VKYVERPIIVTRVLVCLLICTFGIK